MYVHVKICMCGCRYVFTYVVNMYVYKDVLAYVYVYM